MSAFCADCCSVFLVLCRDDSSRACIVLLVVCLSVCLSVCLFVCLLCALRPLLVFKVLQVLPVTVHSPCRQDQRH